MEYALKYQQHLKGSDHLQHGGQYSGVQRVRPKSAHAGHGPESAGGNQGASKPRDSMTTLATWSC